MEACDESTRYRCPGCGEGGTKGELTRSSFLCPRCSLEVAHVDRTPTGTVRGVIGWLLQPGELLNARYRVVSLVGRGGFAATYLVEDLRLRKKRRALKEIPNLLYDESEVDLLSRLHHPGIADIVDRFESSEMTYRDHILIDEEGHVRLIDFGIAKQGGAARATRTIARSATHGFSPPEQELGTGTDIRSDIYALGASLYVLLTGQMPPAAHERVAGRELVRPERLVTGIPGSVNSAILRSLELNLNLRHRSVREFALEIEEVRSPGESETQNTRAIERFDRAQTTKWESGPDGPRAAPSTGRVGRLQRERAVRSRWLLVSWAALVLVSSAASYVLVGRGPSAPEPISSGEDSNALATDHAETVVIGDTSGAVAHDANGVNDFDPSADSAVEALELERRQPSEPKEGGSGRMSPGGNAYTTPHELCGPRLLSEAEKMLRRASIPVRSVRLTASGCGIRLQAFSRRAATRAREILAPLNVLVHVGWEEEVRTVRGR